MVRQKVTVNAEILRVFGYFALVIAAACSILLVANIRARFNYGASDLSFLGYIAAYGIISGWGTVRLKRWGAVMLTAPLVVGGSLLGVYAIRQQQTLGVAAIAIMWIVLLSVPAIFCIRTWRDLN